MAWLLGFGLIFLHFELLSIGGFPLTVAPFLIVVVLARTVSWRLAPGQVLAIALAAALPLALALSDGRTQGTQFFRTYLLWIFAVVVLTMATGCELKALTPPPWLGTATFWTLVVVASYSVLQYVATKAGVTVFYNPWRHHQYLYEYLYQYQYGVVRTPAFYLEPSFDALVICNLVFVSVVTRHRIGLAFTLGAAGLYCTQSLAGYICFALLIALQVRSRPAHDQRQNPLRAPAIVLGGIVLAGVLGNYVVGRFDSISTTGSSVNYRLAAPLTILRETLVHHPFGNPLGSVQSIVTSFGLDNGGLTGTSLDNGAYLIVFYFGWLGIIALVWLVGMLLLRRTGGRGTQTFKAVGAILVANVLNTGGILLPEWVLLMSISVLAWRFAKADVVAPAPEPALVLA